MSRPLVTFALFAYNQERFIRDAVRGALAQTYSPLQIILSDDCSQDRTFDLIKGEVADYTGPHNVLLNRNDRNLGLGGHVNRVMELAKGEVIVAAGGDDVSLPTRTEELVRAWSNGGIFSVYSNYISVDETGLSRGTADEIAPPRKESWQEMIRSGNTSGSGCAHAWDRAVFEVFGPLPNGAIYEDRAIPFRSALLGKTAYIDKCLVKWRRHAANVWKGNTEQAQMDLWQLMGYQAATARMYIASYESWLHDLHIFLTVRPEMMAEIAQAMETITARIEFYRYKVFVAEHTAKHRVRSCLRILRRVRKLGVGPVLKVCLLSASPAIYYKTQRLYNGTRNRIKLFSIS